MNEGPELKLFLPLDDADTRSYLPSAFMREEADAQAKALVAERPDLRLMGAAKAERVGGDGLERGLPAAYGYQFLYRTVVVGG